MATDPTDPKTDAPASKPESKSYDQAYVTRLENEAARHRLAAEAAATERDALRTKQDEAEQAELQKRGEYEQLLLKLKADRAADAEKHATEIAARDRRAIVTEAKVLAVQAGIIDPSDVASLDFADLRIDDSGNVAGLKEKIDELKASKPHWFKAEKTVDEGQGRKRAPVAPSGNGGADPGIDWGAKTSEEVDKYLRNILRA